MGRAGHAGRWDKIQYFVVKQKRHLSMKVMHVIVGLRKFRGVAIANCLLLVV